MTGWSIALAMLSIVSAGVGFVATPIPKLGVAFAFGAPALAIAGVILGGMAMSRLQRAGQSTDAARAGVILNVIAFIPGLLIALTCGLCNAVCSTGEMHMQRDMRWTVGPLAEPDAGPPALQRPALAPPKSQTPNGVSAGAAAPSPPAPSVSPGGLPPPPLPAGPSGSGH